MNAALLPDELVRPKTRLLADLGKGETGYILFTEMIVMPDRSCFVNLEAELGDKSFNKVHVTKRDDDSLHVTVPSDITYELGKPSPRPGANIQPVASVEIGPPAFSSKSDRGPGK